jgi:GT2 family glycosyltransferase/SAM-dependent methyltransferase/peptidoglycan hydrolase CwlO-like protein
MTFPLSAHGYTQDAETGVWQRAGYQSIAYSDGDEPEQRVANAIADASDLSVLSAELRASCTDWPSLYHLSSTRANILRPFQDELHGDILEIGSGCGAISRYLGECGANVLALEGSQRRAAMTRARTRDLNNVTVVCEAFGEFQTDQRFDAITLIGVLEYANLFTQGDAPHLGLLRRVRELLKPDGRLYLAIENQLGLKYFAGAPEDHLGVAMYGVEGRYTANQPQTFGRAALTALLRDAGFDHSDFLAAFPDYKLPTSILTQAGLDRADFDAAAFAWQSAHADPQLPQQTTFVLENAWPEIFKNRLGMDLANSFLVRAGPPPAQEPPLALHYSTNRLKPYCKETRFVANTEARAEAEAANVDAGVLVHYRLLAGARPEAAPPADTENAQAGTGERGHSGLRFHCPATAAYIPGHTLSREFVDLITRTGWQLADVSGFIRRYVGMLEQLLAGNEPAIDWSDAACLLPARCFDYSPQNIVIQHEGLPAAIDNEWSLEGGVALGHLLFRSLLLSMASVQRYAPSPSLTELSRRDFIRTVLADAGYPLTNEDFERYIEREAHIQQAVTGRLAGELREWHPDAPLPMRLPEPSPTQDAYFKQAIHDKDVHITNLEAMIAGCKRTLSELDEQCSGLHQTLLEKNTHAAGLEADIARLTGTIEALTKDVAARDEDVAALRQEASAKDARLQAQEASIASLRHIAAQRDAQIQTHVHDIQALRESTAWKATAPLRWVADQTKRVHRIVRVAPAAVQRAGGIGAGLRKAMGIWRREGLPGIKARVQQQQRLAAAQPAGDTGQHPIVEGTLYKPTASLGRDAQGRYRLENGPGAYTYIPPQRPADLERRIAKLANPPLFSIVVPVYNTPPELLAKAVDSVCAQWYPEWELILADDASPSAATKQALDAVADARITVLRLETNEGIAGATNAALRVARGEYVVFLDHDDELTPDCLYELALCADRDDPDYIYSDEDKLTESGDYTQPHFKPDWSPDAMMSTMFTCHVSCLRRRLIERLGGLRPEFDGCQDWDLILRATEQTTRIAHIPKVLYHWRILDASVASDIGAKPYVLDASRRVREDALRRRGLSGSVEAVSEVPGYFRVNYHLQGAPLVSIIIPSRDNGPVLRRCIDSIEAKSVYRHYEIIVLDNGSVDQGTLDYLDRLGSAPDVHVVRHDAPFNFSELNNMGAAQAKGEVLLFLNDDTEVVSRDWLERMGGYAQLPHIGAVGAKLLYPGGTQIQHAGVLNLARGPQHALLRHESYAPAYFMRNLLEYDWIAVTGACLMMEARKFHTLGQFNTSLPIAYNDVDLCMRAVESGLYNVVCQAVTLIHHESISRGLDALDVAKQERLARELEQLYELHPRFFQSDPFHNPNLHPNGINFELSIG